MSAFLSGCIRRATKSAAVLFCLLAAQPGMAGAAGFVYTPTEMDEQPMVENLCALTFDDGPSIFTKDLLNMLDAEGVKATFFVLGSGANRMPDTVKRELAEGHEVGSHSYSHPNLKAVSYQRKEDELTSTDNILRGLGAEPKFMRPPYGNFNQDVTDIVARLGMRVVTWSLDSLDWKRLPADYSKLPSIHGGPLPQGKLHGVFLFHDIHKRTVDDFPRILADLKKGGCQRFVTLSEYADSPYLDTEPVTLMTRRPRSEAPVVVATAPSENRAFETAQGSASADSTVDATAPIPSTPSPVETVASLRIQGAVWAGLASDDIRISSRRPAVRLDPVVAPDSAVDSQQTESGQFGSSL